MTLAEHFYSINYFKPERLVELTWLPGTQTRTSRKPCVSLQKALSNIARNA